MFHLVQNMRVWDFLHQAFGHPYVGLRRVKGSTGGGPHDLCPEGSQNIHLQGKGHQGQQCSCRLNNLQILMCKWMIGISSGYSNIKLWELSLIIKKKEISIGTISTRLISNHTPFSFHISHKLMVNNIWCMYFKQLLFLILLMFQAFFYLVDVYNFWTYYSKCDALTNSIRYSFHYLTSFFYSIYY